MAKQRKSDSRHALSAIDRRLREIERQMQPLKGLMAEQHELIQARRAITGRVEATKEPKVIRRVTQEEVLAYLKAHPGRLASQIAAEMGVSRMTIAGHLHRGKDSAFERREDGWHARSDRGGKR